MQKEQEISALLRKAKLCELFKRKDKALEVYELIMSTHSEDFRAYFNCAQLFVQQGDEKGLHQAFDLFQQVIKLDSSVVETYGALAAICIKTHKPTEAVHFCRQGLNIQNTNKECLYNINIALRQIGQIEEAINLSWNALISSTKPMKPINLPSLHVLNHPSLIQEQQQQQQQQQQQELTIVCIKWGTKYNAQYVNNLYSALLRNIPEQRTFRLLCYTDDTTDVHPAVKCQSFNTKTTTWQGWWMKAQIFAASTILADWTLYIDLDTVICGSLGFIYDLIEKSREEYQFPQQNPSSKDFYILKVDSLQNEGKLSISLCDIVFIVVVMYVYCMWYMLTILLYL